MAEHLLHHAQVRAVIDAVREREVPVVERGA